MGRVKTTLILLAAVLLVLGLGLSRLDAEAPGGSPPAPLPPPSRGTIDYVRTIDSVRDYSKPKSIWGRLLEWVAGPAEVPQLLRPYGLTQDSEGHLIVADPGQRVVHIFDFERRKYQYLSGGRREPFASPIGVAVDAQDNIYVTDSVRARIYVFNRKGKFIRSLGDPRRGTRFLRPTGLAIDPEQRLIYLTDTLRHQVLVLDLGGAVLRTIGQRGTGPGEFNYPTALTLADGKLYVVDAMNFRIQILTPEGRYLGSFGQLGNRTGTLNRPKGIAADSDGHLYVVDALFETVQVFDSQGRLLYYFGATGSQPGQFVLPAGIYIDPRNQIYVADSYNRRVQVFRYRRVRP
ncbi:MAG: 6-bladed beta-propeller [Terriglobia bacterium]